MTIKVEREALLKLLAAPPLTQLSVPPSRCIEEFEYVYVKKPGLSTESDATEPQDDDSVYTVSTASLSCDAEDREYDKRVSFTHSLVTEEWTREYTPKEDVAKLFYSTEEMQRYVIAHLLSLRALSRSLS